MIDFRYHQSGDIYIIWVASINRYIQLKEPAFRVFELWAKNVEKRKIAKTCATIYALPIKESTRFVEEITGQLQGLLEDSSIQEDAGHKVEPDPETEAFLSAHLYRVGDHLFRFIYRNLYFKELFHPLLLHHETEPGTGYSTCLELYTSRGLDVFRVNDSPARFFNPEEIEAFQGAVFMEILNALHQKQMDDWMGVLHASAVTDGNKAVLFTAPSGSGKSTIAMLMIAQGYASLSDDFVPVAIREPEVFHFPAGISVKPGTAALLKDQLPQLQHLQTSVLPGEELYVAPANSNIHPSVPACAIVFVKYDTEITYSLERESNLSMMNDLIRQSWIAGTPEAAERFLHWYFNLPVYSLRYSDNKSAVEGIIKLFD